MSKRRIAPLTFLRRLFLRIFVALALFWGGGIALFSV
ncbi:MAG TPA: monofunctional biosynthetic peptidoglycan transglycosylase, partial [Salmonella bongori]|nr:monofunctional biosynthetic peptidoglycan transglycosylase [Salmonella bongori]